MERMESEEFKGKPQTDDPKKMHPLVVQQMKQPRCKSSVWIYFQRLDKVVAKCRICNGNYRFGSSISNLRHHAQVKHGEILKLGPVKFLERLKVPEEHLHKLFNSSRKAKKRVPRRNMNNEPSVVDECPVKVEPTTITDIDAKSFEDEDIQKSIESIYEKGEETIVDYMRSSSSIAPPTIRHSDSDMRLESSSNANSLNDDEPEIAFLHSREFINSNPLHTATTNSHSDERFQRLKEERVRAETNYFNKKAAYMERSAEYVDVQKRHLLLQTQKLKMEIAAMKEELPRP